MSGLTRGEDYVAWVRAVNSENNATSLEQEIVVNTAGKFLCLVDLKLLELLLKSNTSLLSVPVTSPPDIFYEDDDQDSSYGNNMWDTPSDTGVDSDPG